MRVKTWQSKYANMIIILQQYYLSNMYIYIYIYVYIAICIRRPCRDIGNAVTPSATFRWIGMVDKSKRRDGDFSASSDLLHARAISLLRSDFCCASFALASQYYVVSLFSTCTLYQTFDETIRFAKVNHLFTIRAKKIGDKSIQQDT